MGPLTYGDRGDSFDGPALGPLQLVFIFFVQEIVLASELRGRYEGRDPSGRVVCWACWLDRPDLLGIPVCILY